MPARRSGSVVRAPVQNPGLSGVPVPPPTPTSVQADPPIPQTPSSPPPPIPNDQPEISVGNINRGRKFPFGLLLLFILFIVVIFGGSFIYFGMSSNKKTAPDVKPVISLSPSNPINAPTILPTVTVFENPFASPSASYSNPFGSNYENPFSQATVSAESESYQNPFDTLK